MSDGDDSLPFMVAPDWVHLPEVPEWIELRYGIRGRPFLQQIVSDIRGRHLRYRIGGLSPDFGERRGPYGPVQALPAGLARHDGPPRIIVSDWDAVKADWAAGTITVARPRGGTSHPHKIEVQWTHIEWNYSLQFTMEAERLKKAAAAISTSRPPSVFWTLPQAIVWLRTGDSELAESYDPLDIAWRTIGIDNASANLHPMSDPYKDAPTPGAIWQRIHRSLTRGDIVAAGPDGPPMFAAYWAAKTTIPYGEKAVVKAEDVRRLMEDIPVQATPKSTKRSGHNGADYRGDDADLNVKMRAMIDAGEARSPTDAARAVVKLAVGYGEEESKVRRLVKNYRQMFPAT